MNEEMKSTTPVLSAEIRDMFKYRISLPPHNVLAESILGGDE